MNSRRLAIAIGVVLVGVFLAGTVLGAAGVGTPEPVVTLENDDDVTYRVTAYTVEDRDAAGYLNFEVTDGDERRLVTYADLIWPDGYRNVTLVDETVDRDEIVVGPDETVTDSLEGWTRGDVTVYVVERGEDRVHERSQTVSCDRRGQEHELRFSSDSGAGSTTTCAGGFGWLLR